MSSHCRSVALAALLASAAIAWAQQPAPTNPPSPGKNPTGADPGGTPNPAATSLKATGAATSVKATGAATPSTAASGAPVSSGYPSAFDGYRPFTEQPVESWRKANDLVGQIGGWQTYAREGQGGDAGTDSRPIPERGMSGMPAASGKSEMPAGHAMPFSAGGTPAPLSPAASSPGPSPAPVKVVPPLTKASPSPTDAATRAPSQSGPAAAPAGDHSEHKKQ